MATLCRCHRGVPRRRVRLLKFPAGRRDSEPENAETLADTMAKDVGAALGCALVVVGDRLGLYRALATHGPVGPADLAAILNLSPRMVREWLLNQATCGYVSYEPRRQRYFLSPEQEALLADEQSQTFFAGAFQFATAMIKAEEEVTEVFRTGEGVAWGEHHPDLSAGFARFSRTTYMHRLLDSLIPAVQGLTERLEASAVVADIGCGYGYATMLMAERFRTSRFIGFDNHPDSIRMARLIAEARGLTDRVSFEIANATDFPGLGYDVISFLGCMHDVARPDECARHCLRALRPDGLIFMVEPIGGERVEDNFNPAGRLMSGASVLCCTPHGMINGGAALGAVVSDGRLEEFMRSAGFRTFRRVMSTRFSRVIEVRP